jgi:uncharacterized protein (DUF952 family)
MGGVRIFHIIDPAQWTAAKATGALTSDEAFLHFSFAHQVAATANRYYRDRPDLMVVEVDAAAVPAELRIEDTTGRGESFPHVYGPVPADAARAEHRLTRDAGGDWVFQPDRAM